MILIIGLGNPGKKFQKTRHNLGFRVVDELGRKNKFPKFKLLKKFKAEISQGKIANQKIILAKPQTFMNLSGKAVKLLIKTYCVNKAMAKLTQCLWIVHDDIDLPLGKIRISIGRGSGGHKGVQSIIDELNTKSFFRLRIGIQRGRTPVIFEKFVLERFTKNEEKIIKQIKKRACEALELAIKEGLEKAMQKFNK